MEALSEQYEIVFISFIRSEKEKEYVKHIKPFCKRIEVCNIERSVRKNIIDAFKSIFLGKSFIVLRDFVTEMQGLIDKVIKEENPDFIHIDHLQMAQYIKGDKKGIKILDEHNVEYQILKRIFEIEKNYFKKIFTYYEFNKLKKVEKEACLESDLVITVSDLDKRTLADMTCNNVRFKTIPIGVDTEYFFYQPIRNKQENAIVFIGTLYWPPNIDAVMWFYKEVWGKLKNNNDIRNLNWKIIGLKPVDEILQLAEIDKNIDVHGSVADVRPFMREGSVFIVPLFSGSGMRVKILNAMACGIPVISTSIGAEGIEGLKPVNFNFCKEQTNYNLRFTIHDSNIWIADKPEEFIDAIMTLFINNELRSQLSQSGRKLMEEKYSWKTQGEKLLAVYEEAKSLRRVIT
ncbi:MAG: glycosyltransferase [bacterium]